MGTLIILAILVLVVLGFNSPVWWLAAAALIYLYVRYVRAEGTSGSSSTGGAGGQSGGGSSSSSGSGSGSATRVDSNYRAYRQRRDRMAKWERRYRRERPWNVKK